MPGLGDLVRVEGDAALFRVVEACAGAGGWAYLTGWSMDAMPDERTRYLQLCRVTVVERG